jgi:hypothetical protein
MNIFYLHNDPEICAQYHVDKHVVKMILEYAQLLSTAHRVLDGTQTDAISDKGRKKTLYVLSDERDSHLYQATHINHPSAKWTRHSAQNYQWLYKMWLALMEEYTFRYGKVHTCEKLKVALANTPNNIPTNDFTSPWRAMPDEFKVPRTVKDYTIQSYRAYYNGSKSHMFKWKNRAAPEWIAYEQAV